MSHLNETAFCPNARKPSEVYLFQKSAATLAFLFHRIFASSVGRRRFCVQERLACFLRKLSGNQVIGFAQQARQFLSWQSVPRLERNPLGTRQVGAGMTLGRSVNSAKVSGDALKERHTEAGSSVVTA